jgi:hypothetical protein
MNTKALILFAVLLSTSAQAFIPVEDREALQVEGMSLTPFWATEYIGADLVKEDMALRSDVKRVPFSIFDIGFEKDFINNPLNINADIAKNGSRKVTAHHGTNVANIINGEGLQSVSTIVDYVQLRNVAPAIYFSSAVKELMSLENKPMVISNSVGWSGAKLVAELAQKVDQERIVWVLAAGNEYPEAMDPIENEASVVLVGSYSPFGQQTIYSQESNKLAILAPADEYMASTDGKGVKGTFGATSGATPLVSATIANAKSIMPSLNREQAVTLIKKTAIRSLSFYYRENKTALLNSYKFFNAVSEIKETCDTDLLCIDKEINNFQDLKHKKFHKNTIAKEYCSGASSVMTTKALNNLRRDFLQSPEDKKLTDLLSCVYKKAGYDLNADYYENVNLTYTNPRALQEKIKARANQAILNDYQNSSALRDVELLDENFLNLLLEISSSDAGIGRAWAKIFLERVEQTSRVNLKVL